MGRSHRENRKVLKEVFRRFGIRETELGELREDISKAEARRRLFRRDEVQQAILGTAIQKAKEEIWAIEDAHVLAVFDKILGPPGRPWWKRLLESDLV